MNQIQVLLENMTIRDIVDILVVAFIAYRFLLIIQGTRAVQMIFGVGILVLLFWASFNYELYSLNWVLSHLFDYSFIFLIILFQDHIRRALVSFGAGSFIGKTKSYQMEDAVEEVVMACVSMSSARIGGLIVFMRMNGLLNYAESGTSLNSDVHSDLICSLFQTKSPLHDGAVIIADGKIMAAGCFLPLSRSLEIKRDYGTRHRAALGLSEVTDAVIVIVSEETGHIKLCAEGVIRPLDDENSLRMALKNALI